MSTSSRHVHFLSHFIFLHLIFLFHFHFQFLLLLLSLYEGREHAFDLLTVSMSIGIGISK
jgi:hypothetical protein